MPFENRVFEAPKLVSTKTLVLKHGYCSQGLLDLGWQLGRLC